MSIKKDGIMVILSSPSGAGKTTLVKLLSSKKNFNISVSHTTRKPRINEIPNQDYYFVDHKKFQGLIKNEEFLEYAKVFNHLYGTTRSPVIEKLEKGENVVFDIDWQGAQQVRMKKPNVTTIFISPPSKVELKNRLRKRGQDSDEIIESRMAQAQAECSHYNEFDYIIVNDNFDQALSELTTVVYNQRLTLSQQKMSHQRIFNDLLR